MTGFNTQVGGGMYRLQLETDRAEVFNAIQRIARQFVDAENPRKVVVSKMENTTVVEDPSVRVMHSAENTEENNDA